MFGDGKGKRAHSKLFSVCALSSRCNFYCVDQIVQIAKEKKQLTKEEKQRREKAIKLRMRIEQAETLEEIAQIEEEMKKGNFDEVLAEMDEEDAKSE